MRVEVVGFILLFGLQVVTMSLQMQKAKAGRSIVLFWKSPSKQSSYTAQRSGEDLEALGTEITISNRVEANRYVVAIFDACEAHPCHFAGVRRAKKNFDEMRSGIRSLCTLRRC